MASNNIVVLQHDDIFKTLQNHIQLVSAQINEGTCTREDSVDFNKDTYWNNVAAVFKVLSMETTKISLAFSKKPFPSNKNTEALVHELEKTMLALVSIYYTLPLTQGVTLRCHFKQAVLHVLDHLEKFVATLSDCFHSKEGDERIQWTGGVWEAASLELIRDNKECVANKLRERYELVDDALEELEEACSDEGVEVDTETDLTPAEPWSEQDKRVVNSCPGIVKTMKNVLKKAQECVDKRGNVETQGDINTLDELAALTCDVSSLVDDFVSAIYVPLNYATFVSNGTVLSDSTRSILKFLRDSNLTTNEDEKWLDILSRACDHNLDKLKSNSSPATDQNVD
ncbi:cyclin-D1-binding protein 1 homolog [Biomphalaria glabrata]|uniref:Cyclin-D1-binding protein 1 homolog n=1 Tax=Biomphalaria glabrata TaxID=6526 RepID=A0A9W3AWH3_BIOGL|nr:cyclin-D1-binding protein 1 homolog [Biomphalaria glabrata]